jgi:hypothetical protein
VYDKHESEVYVMDTVKEVENAANRLRDAVGECLPKCIFIGEEHPIHDTCSTYRQFFQQVICELLAIGYRNVCIELNHYACKDLDALLHGRLDLKTFRSRWIGPTTIWTKTKDDFFLGLKQFVQQGGKVTAINKCKDPGRDRLMSRRIIKAISHGEKVVYLCGSVHAMLRESSEKDTWQSCAELVANAIDRSSVFSIVEVSRSLVVSRNYDLRLQSIFEIPHIRLLLANEVVHERDAVLLEMPVGKGFEFLTEFRRQRLIERVRHHDAVYFDTVPFLADWHEEVLRHRPVKYS